jgi:cytochrome b
MQKLPRQLPPEKIIGPMQSDRRPQLIWDLPLRLWHWALVVCLAALALVLFRLAWALLGTFHSRYATFLASPKQVLAYLRKAKDAEPSAGHNPLGGWASVAIVVLIGLQAGIGLFISDDIFYAGPYNTVVSSSTADWLAGWHHRLFTLIQITALVHVLAVSWYTWGKKEGLIQAMLHGKKTLQVHGAGETVNEHRGLRALLLLALAATVVAILVYVAPLPDYEIY